MTEPILIPGDKSLSHRAVLFSYLIPQKIEVQNFLEAEDPINTMKSFQKLGLQVEKLGKGKFQFTGVSSLPLNTTPVELDFGNAGTGIRLSLGLLAGLANSNCILSGDQSLQKRPMKRVLEPLRKMKADVGSVRDDDKAPLFVRGKKLSGIYYNSEIASAQVKSAVMLAAIASGADCTYKEIEQSRDHTENLFRYLGGKIKHFSEKEFSLSPPYKLEPKPLFIPSDISSASFFIVLACISKKTKVEIPNIGLNPSRIGILNLLKRMGAKITIMDSREECGEKVGTIVVESSDLEKVEISKSEIPSIIDEIPILSIAGLFAKGGFEIRHAEELRAKESDRITIMVQNLRNIGVEVEEFPDGYAFGDVSKIHSAKIETHMDHRIAMSFLILQTATGVSMNLDDTTFIDTSFPEFLGILRKFQ